MKGLAALTVAGSLSLALAASPSAAVSLHNAPPPDDDSSTSSTSISTSTTSPDHFDRHDRSLISEEAARKCRPRQFFRFHDFHPRNFYLPRTRFIDGPGGTMTATVRRQHRVYAEIEIERVKGSSIERANIDRATLVRSLANNVNPLLAEEFVVEAGHDYTREISKGKYGNLWYRVFGYRVGFTAWRQVRNCTVRPVAAGIANIPARVEGWRYWETKRPMFQGRPLSPR
ncbi:hypothetical protein GCM10010517_02110 [Streptosporangium fragile]|uniref:Uncharacterized protein n=1 Tax=Streptosporangium fragile TaxID=46186 RepID=A0ABP6I518_9ACTN